MVVQLILDALIQSGARAAEPGEFTRRAFLNGRIDLSQAEAVGDLIAARTDKAVRASLGLSAEHQVVGMVARLREISPSADPALVFGVASLPAQAPPPQPSDAPFMPRQRLPMFGQPRTSVKSTVSLPCRAPSARSRGSAPACWT